MPSLPKGSTYAIATAIGAAIAVTVATNAASAVLTTAVDHGLVDGDIVEFTSGWVKASRRVFKVDALTANTLALVDCDTQNLALFPAGGGIGSIKKLSQWVQIPKVMNPQSSGGEPKNATYEFIEDEQEYNIHNGWSAVSYTMEIDDDTTTPGYAASMKASDEQTDTCLRILKKGGLHPTYLPCNVAMNPIPKQQEGQIDRLSVQFNGRGRPTRYTGAVTG